MSFEPAEQLFHERNQPDHCSECGREPRAGENTLDTWRVELDGLENAYDFCPECWDREFGDGRLD